MKIITSSNGKKTLKISKKEWQKIGQGYGWEGRPDQMAYEMPYKEEEEELTYEKAVAILEGLNKESSSVKIQLRELTERLKDIKVMENHTFERLNNSLTDGLITKEQLDDLKDMIQRPEAEQDI